MIANDIPINAQHRIASQWVFGLAGMHMLYYIACLAIDSGNHIESIWMQLDGIVVLVAITIILLCTGLSVRRNNRLGLSIWALVVFGMHFFVVFILVVTNIFGGEWAPLEVIIGSGIITCFYSVTIISTYRAWKLSKNNSIN